MSTDEDQQEGTGATTPADPGVPEAPEAVAPEAEAPEAVAPEAVAPEAVAPEAATAEASEQPEAAEASPAPEAASEPGSEPTSGSDSASDEPQASEPDDSDPFPDAADDDLVTLDRLGEPVAGGTVRGLVLAPGLPEASRARVAQVGRIELTDDLARAGSAALILLSTRIPRAELSAILAAVSETANCPIMALVHTGGESLAVDVMRRGGAGVIAEGNEAALAVPLARQPSNAGLLDSYDRSIARSETGTGGGRGRDHVTGLPDRAGFDVRLANLEQEGEVPRLAFARITRTPQVPEELAEEAANLVRRRIAAQFLHVVRLYDAELYALGGWDFGIVGVNLSPNATQYMGRDLERIATTYAPAGASTLSVAVGHAGSEVSTDITSLREAGQRALDAAVTDRTTLVVSADSLSLGVSSTTELEAALRVLEFVERQSRFPAGHGHRVGELAARIAAELGYDGVARSRIQLAGHFHAIGMAGLPAEAIAGFDTLTGELLQAYRNHPVTGADYLRVSAGDDVAAAVRGYRERWDGAGFPDGLVEADIPISARIIATAHVAEELLYGPLENPESNRIDGAIAGLRERAGSHLDPDIAAIAIDLIDQMSVADLEQVA